MVKIFSDFEYKIVKNRNKLIIQWTNYYYSDAWSPSIRSLMDFHEHAIVFLIFVFSFITAVIVKIFFSKPLNLNLIDNEKLEVFWTIRPGLILVFLAIPSLQVLYFIEEASHPLVTLKVVGHQWYWSYEYSDLVSFIDTDAWPRLQDFDRYLGKSLNNRLLSTDNSILLPYKLQIRGLITSEDVLHSWAVPSLGVKIDANPGRINMINFIRIRSGSVFGQCSEICGVNHSLIPIIVEFSRLENFRDWMLVDTR